MVQIPSHISRPTVSFSAQPPTVYSGGVSRAMMQQTQMMSGGGASSSGGLSRFFSFPQFNLSSWIQTKDGQFIARIFIAFIVLGLLAFVLHKWFKNRLEEDASFQPSCPTWLMGSPIPGTCSFQKKENYKNKKKDDDDETDSEEEETDDEEEVKPKNKNRKTKGNGRENFAQKKGKRREKFTVLGKPHPMEQGQRDIQSYTQLRSSYGPKEIPHEYATCLQTNPDNHRTCDFWKNLDAKPRPVRKLMRANDFQDVVPLSKTYPLFENAIPAASMSGGGAFGNYASVNFSS